MSDTAFWWRIEDGYAVVEAAAGEVDLCTQAGFAKVLDQAVSTGAELVVVDLSGVRFFAAVASHERCK